MDNFKIIYKILRYLEESMDYSKIDLSPIKADGLEVSSERWRSIIKMLYDNGYVEGIQVKVLPGNNISLNKIENIRITLKGLEYLQENSLMKKAYNMIKGVSDLMP